MSLEDGSSQASYFANQFLFADKIKTPEEKLQEIDKVKKEQIQKLAKQIFKPNQMRLAVIGDIEKEDLEF